MKKNIARKIIIFALLISLIESSSVYASERTNIKEIVGEEQNLRASTVAGQWIQASDGRWWYRHSDGSYTKNGWEYINGKW